MAYALLISTEDVKKFTITNGNLDADDFIEYIKISQDITIQNYLGTKLNCVTIPRITYKEAVQILEKEMELKLQEVGLTTQAEKLISEYVKSKSNSDFVFITKYPLSERPFYAMPSNDGFASETFELLYKGTEITSGGQRIHNYQELVDSIKSKGLNSLNI